MATRSIDPRSPQAVIQRLIAFRQAKGLIQAAFARSLGKSNQAIWNYEKGGQNVSKEMAFLIMSSHGLDSNFIWEGNLKCLDDDFKVIYLQRLANPKEPGEVD